MNIVEAYIQLKGQLIILISGMSGSGKIDLAKEIERDFKIERLNLDKYYRPDFDKKIKLSNGIEIVDWDNVDAIDWHKFNGDVQKMKKRGVVISGFAFIQKRLNFGDGSMQDFHFHLKNSQETILEKRHAFLEAHRTDLRYKDIYEMKDSKTEKLMLFEITYPIYLASLEQSVIDLIYNGDAKTVDDIYDDIYEHIIGQLSEYLYEKSKFETSKKRKHDLFTKKKEASDSADSAESDLAGSEDFTISSSITKILL